MLICVGFSSSTTVISSKDGIQQGYEKGFASAAYRN